MGDHEQDLALAMRLADAADAVSIRWFTGAPMDAETKDDGSPVTEADRAVERRVAEIVASERPGDGVLGEEVGALVPAGPSGRRWIVDGIDGTVLFVRGDRGWATEIALEVAGEIVVGVSTHPAFGARWWASRGGGTWRTVLGPVPGAPGGPAGSPGPEPVPVPVPARVRVADRPVGGEGPLRIAIVPPVEALSGPPRRVAERLATAGSVLDTPIHGALLVAQGEADVCLQPIGGPWDLAAVSLIVEEAGGRFSDLAGRADVHGGGPALYGTPSGHAAALAALAPR